MVPNFDLCKYQQGLNNNSVLLVPNQRLARKLISYTFEQQCIAKSIEVITGFSIYSLSDFVDYIYNIIYESGRIEDSKYLLNAWQREVIFKNIIENYVREDNKFSHVVSPSIYKKVLSAWQIQKQWNVPHDFLTTPSPEIELFNIWTKEYKDILNQSQYSDPDDKIVLTVSALNKDLLRLLNIDNIDLYGFDDLSPVYRNFFDKLEQDSVHIRYIDNININSDLKSNFKLHEAHDIEDEFDKLSDWALHHYEQGTNDVGIIVPNLTQHRQLISRKFSEKFICRDAWNISGGEPLLDIPVIKVAILLLDILNYASSLYVEKLNSTIKIQSVIYLLQSSYYLKNAQNKSAVNIKSQVHDLIFLLQRDGYKELTIKDFIYHIGKINKSFIDNIIHQKIQALQLPSAWAKNIWVLLANLGWPVGEANKINSLEYQAIMQLQKCCYRLSELDKLLGSVSFNKICVELKNLLQDVPFQIETNKNSIDILGMLEGAGLFYNKLWIANLTSDIWPMPPDPNPFIAIDLQRKYNLPHSTVEREFEYAKKLTRRYLTSSKDIIISYNKFDGEKENNFSFLLDSEQSLKLEIELENKDKNYLPDLKININQDFSGPAIENSHIKNGVKALSLQITCPFRAFAEIRLNAVSIKNLDIGPAAWLRGQVIHDVLQYFYIDYNTKSKIVNLYADQENYKSYLNDLILKSLMKYRIKYFNIYKLGIVKLEQEVIYNIINPFIALDIQRQEFTVISVEENCFFKLDSVQFNVRVDRIDRIDRVVKIDNINNREQENQIVIIDYKTSTQNINNLFKEELTEPQLPIYLFLDKHTDTQAVIFAELLYQHASYKGIGSDKIFDGCVKIDEWDKLKNKWYDLLKTSALSFANGEAKRQPLNLEATCRTCHLSGLCRKDEVWH